ncbi:hypothetical protein K2X30_12395 [bacterium]|nr:hypothetical protein [bacterium]
MLVSSGCTTAYRKSVGADANGQVFTRIFFADFNTSWAAVTESLKSYSLDISNRDSGFLQTRWTDNTSQKNFIDSFGAPDQYLQTKYRFKVTVATGFYNMNKQGVRISVLKEQLVQRDALEDPKTIPTDGIEENTLLYRIGRVILMRLKIDQIEQEKNKKEVESVTF